MSKVRLEDCPFCGGPGKGKDIPMPFRHGWVGCPECGIYKNWVHTPREAVRRWNTRVRGVEDAAPYKGNEVRA